MKWKTDDGAVVDVYAGGRSRGLKQPRGKNWLLINLTSSDWGSKPPFGTNRPSAFKRILSWEEPIILRLPVADMKAPDWGREFLEDLIDDIEDIAREQEDHQINVLIFCEGGHGRTGTVLAALVGLVFQEVEPIKWVREHYCPSAVESTSQIIWIEDVLDLKLDDTSAKSYGTYQGGSYAGV